MLRSLLQITFALTVVASAWAQTNVGRIAGSVQDSSGAFIPDGAITATNPATGFKSSLKTDASGLKTDMMDVKGRLDKLEALVRKQGRDSAAMLVMMRGTVGIYDERMKVIEEDVRLIMERE